jgi:hypothetical protein
VDLVFMWQIDNPSVFGQFDGGSIQGATSLALAPAGASLAQARCRA